MPVKALAAAISKTLSDAGIEAVLSGGAAVQIYSHNRYVSKDLDFVTHARRQPLAKALAKIGFSPTKSRRLFSSPRTEYLIEFPAGPLAFGDEVIRDWARIQTPHGELHIVTPTQCVQDRLAAYFHWKDLQSLEQAVDVALYQEPYIHFAEIQRWARKENCVAEHVVFAARVAHRRNS